MIEICEFDAKEILSILDDVAEGGCGQRVRWGAMYMRAQLKKVIKNE